MEKKKLEVDIKVRINHETDEKLKLVCAQEGTKRATWIRQAILKELEQWKSGNQ